MSGLDRGDTRERRRHIRFQIMLDAMLELGSRPAQACQVFNMSIEGASVEHMPGVRLGEAAVLHLEGFGPVRGHVARVSSTIMGLAFEDCDAPALAAYIQSHCNAIKDTPPAPVAVVPES